MTLPNRLAIQALCAQIEQLVGGQDIDMMHAQGGVRVNVFGGHKAKAEEELTDALKAYLNAKRTSGTITPQMQAKLAQAVDDWASKMGY